MKKLILSCAIALTAAVSFTSCAKETCYVCELTAATLTTSIEVCGEKATTSVGGVSSASVDIPGGVSAADYRTSLETAGYTCNDK